MNHVHTFPVRAFSAESSVIPRSMPITSGFVHPFTGWNASVKPYRFQTRDPYRSRMYISVPVHIFGSNMSDPPAAHGTSVPSIGPSRGGPPHDTYPFALSDAVIPHRSPSSQPGNP